jgi:hypothetical protein
MPQKQTETPGGVVAYLQLVSRLRQTYFGSSALMFVGALSMP